MKKFRSNCPLGRTLDILGDKWTLLVLRDIVAFGKTTFKEISAMKEGVATNILADRLHKLVEEGFITKTPSKENKKVFHYRPTKMSLDLVPAILQIREWSEKYLFKPKEKPAAIGLVKKLLNN